MFSNTRVINSGGYVASLQLTQQPGNMSPNVLKVEGYYEGAVQAWIQFFDSLGAPANGTACLYEESLGVVAPNGFSWQFNPGIIMRLQSALASQPLVNGLVVCVSTTEGTLTLGTGGNLSTFFVTLEEWEVQPQGAVTQSGDTTTNRTTLTPWVDGAFHTIDKIIVSNKVAAASFLKLYTTSPVAGQLPLQQWALAASQGLTELNFRGVNYQPTTEDETVTPPVVHNGCYLVNDTVTGGYSGALQNMTAQVNYI